MINKIELTENTPIDQLKNLGDKSSKWLAKIGIHTLQDLRESGSIKTFLKLDARDDFKPSLNFLYAMEAALQHKHWNKIVGIEKSNLLASLDEMRLHQAVFKTNENIDIQHTKNWIREFIIHHNVCPFAKRVVDNNSIDFHLITSENIEHCLLEVIDHIIKLSKNDQIETALLIFTNVLSDFDEYLEFLAIANQLIEDHEFDKEYQLASFHPDYCFEGEASNDPANYTNRSPKPMLHIIRQSSIAKALTFYDHPEQIPEQNIKLLRELGEPYLRQLTAHCKENLNEH